MILNQAQAEAVYSAMCALNNVSANRGVELRFVGGNDGDYNRYGVKEEADGEVTVYVGPGILGREREDYANQAAFASAYGLS